MAIRTRRKTTKETVKAMVGKAVVAVYFTDGNPKKGNNWLAATGRIKLFFSGDPKIMDYPEVLPDLYKAIGEAMEYIQLAKA